MNFDESVTNLSGSVKVEVLSKVRYDDNEGNAAIIYGFEVDGNTTNAPGGTALNPYVSEDFTFNGKTYAPFSPNAYTLQTAYDPTDASQNKFILPDPEVSRKSMDFKNFLIKEAAYNNLFQDVKSSIGKKLPVKVQIVTTGIEISKVTSILLPGIDMLAVQCDANGTCEIFNESFVDFFPDDLEMVSVTHRGLWGWRTKAAPQNTIAAIDKANDTDNNEMMELDFAMTKDGVVFLSHDEQFQKNLQGILSNMPSGLPDDFTAYDVTWDQIKDYYVYSRQNTVDKVDANKVVDAETAFQHIKSQKESGIQKPINVDIVIKERYFPNQKAYDDTVKSIFTKLVRLATQYELTDILTFRGRFLVDDPFWDTVAAELIANDPASADGSEPDDHRIPKIAYTPIIGEEIPVPKLSGKILSADQKAYLDKYKTDWLNVAQYRTVIPCLDVPAFEIRIKRNPDDNPLELNHVLKAYLDEIRGDNIPVMVFSNTTENCFGYWANSSQGVNSNMKNDGRHNAEWLLKMGYNVIKTDYAYRVQAIRNRQKHVTSYDATLTTYDDTSLSKAVTPNQINNHGFTASFIVNASQLSNGVKEVFVELQDANGKAYWSCGVNEFNNFYVTRLFKDQNDVSCKWDAEHWKPEIINYSTGSYPDDTKIFVSIIQEPEQVRFHLGTPDGLHDCLFMGYGLSGTILKDGWNGSRKLVMSDQVVHFLGFQDAMCRSSIFSTAYDQYYNQTEYVSNDYSNFAQNFVVSGNGVTWKQYTDAPNQDIYFGLYDPQNRFLNKDMKMTMYKSYEDDLSRLGSCQDLFSNAYFPQSNQVLVYLNGQQKAIYSLTEPNTSAPTLNALVGDELKIEAFTDSETPPSLGGLPDLWIARAFREAIFMSSKSIKPGAYRPWIGFDVSMHTSQVRKYGQVWYDETKPWKATYPGWHTTGDQNNGYRHEFTWTLQRTMDAQLTYDYNDKYPEEDASWNQTSAKIILNDDGSPKQRQGHFVGIQMAALHGLKGDLQAAYGSGATIGASNQFTTGRYNVSDNDDVFLSEFQDPSVTPFAITPPNATMNRSYNTIWQGLPANESPNPIVDLVSWYQEQKGESQDYVYDGYEIYETSSASKAPGMLRLTDHGNSISIKIDVRSPLTTEKFYSLANAAGSSAGSMVVTSNDFTIGINDKVDKSRVFNNSVFNLVFGSMKNDIDDQYVIKDLTVDTDGTLNAATDLKFDVMGDPPHRVFLTYRRTPYSEPVVISGFDVWLDTKISGMKCLEYTNDSESRDLGMTEYQNYKISAADKRVDVPKYLQTGYFPEAIDHIYVINKGETLTFMIWDRDPFLFKNDNPDYDVSFYISPRMLSYRIEESEAAKRVQWELDVLDQSGTLQGQPTVLQAFGTGSETQLSHTFSNAGYYIFRSKLEKTGSQRQVLVIVMEPDAYNVNEEGIVQMRDLTSAEIAYIQARQPSFSGSGYKLAMMTDLSAASAWKKPEDLGLPRSYMTSTNQTKFIDRFAPYNDYADHYVYLINGEGTTKRTQQNVLEVSSYVVQRFPEYVVQGYYSYHMDPLSNIESEFGIMPSDITSTFIDGAFTEVTTNSADYTVDYNGTLVNSRNIKPWEVRNPWLSISKYHGFRLRTNVKTLLDANIMETHILSGNYEPPVDKPYKINPKIASFDTDDERLEYEFLLNLAYNRWIVIPDNTSSISYFHADDQDNLIASKQLSNSSSARTDTTYQEFKANLRDTNDGFNVFPNPSNGNDIHAIVDLDYESHLHFTVFSLSGHLVHESLHVGQKGRNEIIFEGFHQLLKRGLYKIHVSGDGIEKESFLMISDQ